MLSYAPKSVCGLVYLKSPKKNDIIYIKMCVRVFVCHLFLFSQRRVDISSIHRKCKRVKTFCEWNLILIVLVLWKWYRCFLFRQTKMVRMVYVLIEVLMQNDGYNFFICSTIHCKTGSEICNKNFLILFMGNLTSIIKSTGQSKCQYLCKSVEFQMVGSKYSKKTIKKSLQKQHNQTSIKQIISAFQLVFRCTAMNQHQNVVHFRVGQKEVQIVYYSYLKLDHL